MPNLVGIWDPEADEGRIREILAQQLERVRVPGIDYSEYVAALPGMGVGLLDHGILENGSQPARSSDGSLILFLEGEIYNAAELRKAFRHELDLEGTSPPGLCAELIRRFGPEIADQFNGLFSIVYMDLDAKNLTLVSDRLGFRPIFHVERGRSVVFASEIKAICAVDPGTREIDETGLLELFCYDGSHFMNRTWLAEYGLLEAATISTISTNGIRRQRYWHYKYDESAPTLDQTSYVTVYNTLLDRAVERAMQGSQRIGIFLSGGYDSRAVAASIRRHHLPIPAITFGDPDSRDARFAAQLADRLGFDHHLLSNQAPYLYDVCPAVVWRTEGMLSFAHTTSIVFHERIKHELDIFLTGIVGEYSGSHIWPRLLLARTREAAIATAFEHTVQRNLGVVQRVFQPAFFERMFESVRTRFHDSFELVDNDHPLNMIDCWDFLSLTPQRVWLSPTVDRHKFETRAPMLDRDLVDFALTIPPYARLEQRIYKKVIAYGFPGIRNIPCTNSAQQIDPHFATEYAKMAGRLVARKAWGPVSRLLRRDTGLGRELSDMDAAFRAEPALADNLLRPLMKDGVLPPDIFNHAGIEAMLAEQYAGNGSHWNLISQLVSWGLGAQFFLHDDFSRVPKSMYAPGAL